MGPRNATAIFTTTLLQEWQPLPWFHIIHSLPLINLHKLLPYLQFPYNYPSQCSGIVRTHVYNACACTSMPRIYAEIKPRVKNLMKIHSKDARDLADKHSNKPRQTNSIDDRGQRVGETPSGLRRDITQ